MINYNDNNCATCGGVLKYYDTARRTIRSIHGKKQTIAVRRYRCGTCSKIHRETPPYNVSLQTLRT